MVNTIIKTENEDVIINNHNIIALPNKGDTIDFSDRIYEVIRINYVALKTTFGVSFFPEIIVKQIL